MKKGWEEVGGWYDSLVGQKGHYYHDHVILPKVISFLKAWKASSVLDLACGQGVLERHIPKMVRYVGIDISPTLIRLAEGQKKQKGSRFIVADLTRPLTVTDKKFDAAALILAAQDIDDLEKVFATGAECLQPGGRLVVVMNHPCFRIPRQSGWGVDEENKLQYRQMSSYMSPLSVPIQTRPSARDKSPKVTYYHRPLSYYAEALAKSGFLIETIEEWTSDKKSEGKMARMENRARKEFPLFLCLVGRKVPGRKKMEIE